MPRSDAPGQGDVSGVGVRRAVMAVLAMVVALAGTWQTAAAAPPSTGAPSTPGLAIAPTAAATRAATVAVNEPATQALARRVLESADHGRLPFAIVDKQSALITVYQADGSVAGMSTVLLGRTPGDLATTGVGDRAQNGTLRAEDLTTPAGRFASLPGRNRAGDSVVWLDYANALAIHRLRPAPAAQRREQRMASDDPRDKRISAGCVVVPVAFFDSVVSPILGRGEAVVYVLPEVSGQWASLLPQGVPAAVPVSTPMPAGPAVTVGSSL
jgi:hypothetical protein